MNRCKLAACLVGVLAGCQLACQGNTAQPAQTTGPASRPPAPSQLADTTRAIPPDSTVLLVLSLPDEALLPAALRGQLNASGRRALVKRTELASGYVLLAHANIRVWEGSTQVALFPRAAGGFVAVANRTECQGFGGCTDSYTVWEGAPGRWADATARAFAELPPPEVWRRAELAAGHSLRGQHLQLGVDVPPFGNLVGLFLVQPNGAPRLGLFRWDGTAFRWLPDARPPKP